MNSVLALKSYSEWKQNGANGAWKFGGALKPTTLGKSFVRKNSEPFTNSLSRTSSTLQGSLTCSKLLVPVLVRHENTAAQHHLLVSIPFTCSRCISRLHPIFLSTEPQRNLLQGVTSLTTPCWVVRVVSYWPFVHMRSHSGVRPYPGTICSFLMGQLTSMSITYARLLRTIRICVLL